MIDSSAICRFAQPVKGESHRCVQRGPKLYAQDSNAYLCGLKAKHRKRAGRKEFSRFLRKLVRRVDCGKVGREEFSRRLRTSAYHVDFCKSWLAARLLF
jgi:hypothetical protein